MNLLEEIQNAPVEWKELGEVCIIANTARKPVKANDRISGEIPYYGANNIQDYVEGYTHDGEYILIAEDGSAKLDEYSIQYVNGKFWANNHVHVIKPKENLLSRFIYHYLTNFDFKPYLSGGTRAKLTKASLVKIPLPVPSLEIQEKIVQRLDKFTDYVTELTSELTSELTLRQKQYSYFRDYLLNFDQDSSGGANNKVEWKTLGEILEKGKGTKITASQMKSLHQDGAPIRIFAGGKTFADVPYGTIPDKDVHNEPSIIVKSRGIIEFEYYTKPFSFKNEFWSYSSSKENINLKYIYYCLNNKQQYFQDIANKMQMPQIASRDTENFKIPIPPLSIQEKIVHVLDNFDTVCNDLNIGLPKEIELRQKQYEYFRDQLLTYTAEGVYTDSTVQYSTDKT